MQTYKGGCKFKGRVLTFGVKVLNIARRAFRRGGGKRGGENLLLLERLSATQVCRYGGVKSSRLKKMKKGRIFIRQHAIGKFDTKRPMYYRRPS